MDNTILHDLLLYKVKPIHIYVSRTEREAKYHKACLIKYIKSLDCSRFSIFIVHPVKDYHIG